ncbi:hypothetical protein GJ744_006936 [Endocarpon pusillum]|uniref:Uncharacterized protein n=1 Tax=Endocarpon pusillum TaxID=364733 RepID=A0A8H7AJG6_9EURO|nr:hypothetical protein GJ744_006936 [Endocarpon pusillum]
MYKSHGSHTLLAQVPLTVSPFISLPTAVTLPYTYKSVPSSLPPSATVDSSSTEKPKYVVSSSGHAAHPDEIIASCKGLQEHLQRAKDEAATTLKEWEKKIKEKELAEKRRVAPGWLDREEKILEPTKARRSQNQPDLLDSPSLDGDAVTMLPTIAPSREGEELDRAFGGLDVK